MSRHTIIKSTLAILLAITLLGAALFWWTSSPPTPPDSKPSALITSNSPRAALHGTLLDSSGQPIKGATLTDHDLSSTSSEQGAFSFERLPKTLTLSPPEPFVLPEHLTLIPVPDDPSSPLTLTLPNPSSLQGTILAAGRPLQGASISVLYLAADGPLGPVEPFTLDGVTLTDETGSFSLDAILPGRIQLLIESSEHPFYSSKEITLLPDLPGARQTIDVNPNTQLAIELLDQQGNPLQGQLVLTSSTPGLLSPTTHRTDARGTLSLQGLPPDTPLTLLATARGHQPERVTLTLDLSEPSSEQIVLEPLADPNMFSAIVLDPNYQPVHNATMFIGAPNQRPKTSNTQGLISFTLPELPSNLQVELISPRHPPLLSETLVRGEAKVFVFGQGGSISGQVVASNGRPVTSYALTISDFRPSSGPYPRRRNNLPSAQVDDPQGTFTFGPLRPGTYYLEATPKDLASAESSPISVSANQTTTNITLTVQEPGRVQGTVIDRATGNPLAGATVALTSTNRATLTTKTDAQGRYTLEGVSPGRQSVRVSMPKYTTQFAAGVEVSPGGTTTQDVDLEKGNAKRGFSFHGIGATLEKRDSGIIIRNVMQGSPALDAGVKDGDAILSIDGKSTENMRVIDAVELIRGQEDSPVTLDISRPNQGRLTITVIRGKVKATR